MKPTRDQLLRVGMTLWKAEDAALNSQSGWVSETERRILAQKPRLAYEALDNALAALADEAPSSSRSTAMCNAYQNYVAAILNTSCGCDVRIACLDKVTQSAKELSARLQGLPDQEADDVIVASTALVRDIVAGGLGAGTNALQSTLALLRTASKRQAGVFRGGIELADFTDDALSALERSNTSSTDARIGQLKRLKLSLKVMDGALLAIGIALMAFQIADAPAKRRLEVAARSLTAAVGGTLVGAATDAGLTAAVAGTTLAGAPVFALLAAGVGAVVGLAAGVLIDFLMSLLFHGGTPPALLVKLNGPLQADLRTPLITPLTVELRGAL